VKREFGAHVDSRGMAARGLPRPVRMVDGKFGTERDSRRANWRLTSERGFGAGFVPRAMRKRRKPMQHTSAKLSIIAVLVGTVSGLGPTAAVSAPLQGPLQLRSAAPALTQTVQYRRWHHRGHRHGWRHHRRDGWVGPAAGLAAGAIIGGALAAQRAQAASDAEVAYCMRRFRSYDPESGTYLGYDGDRHPCP
jgi:hypothetical protein